MYYYAMLGKNNICTDVLEFEEEQTWDALIPLESYATHLIGRYKYENSTWVALTPEEGAKYDTRVTKHTDPDGAVQWLDDWLNDVLFQSASDGKTAIANAITGVDESITIPDNPTFAQLAACIGQISTGMQVATGSMNVYTIPDTIDGTTPFQPKIVIVYNFGTGLSNFNMGVYVSPEVTGVTSQQISDSANGIGNKLSRRANAFTITENGFSMVNSGAATDLKWIALG